MTGKNYEECLRTKEFSQSNQKSLLMCIFILLCSISNLVYCMRTENIESVMCNGKWIMKDRKILNINEVT